MSLSSLECHVHFLDYCSSTTYTYLSHIPIFSSCFFQPILLLPPAVFLKHRHTYVTHFSNCNSTYQIKSKCFIELHNLASTILSILSPIILLLLCRPHIPCTPPAPKSLGTKTPCILTFLWACLGCSVGLEYSQLYLSLRKCCYLSQARPVSPLPTSLSRCHPIENWPLPTLCSLHAASICALFSQCHSCFGLQLLLFFLFPPLYWLRIWNMSIFSVLSTLFSIVVFPSSFSITAHIVSDGICMVRWSKMLRLLIIRGDCSEDSSCFRSHLCSLCARGLMGQDIYGTFIHMCHLYQPEHFVKCLLYQVEF